MAALRGANLALRFLLELCLLAALGSWGARVGPGVFGKVALGSGAPLLLAIVWGTFMSPKARVRLHPGVHLAVEAVLFGLGVAALYATDRPRLALALALAWALHRLVMWRL